MHAHSSFPGGTSLTALDVYEDAAPDGVCGGSPHVHLVSTEAYVVTHGSGELHTLDPSGFRVTQLAPGVVVWFTPGTVHRAVNTGDLRVVVLMSNAGLPEAGDAVMTFPADVLSDPAAYAEAAVLPMDERAREAAAARRRDLAVVGFTELRDRIVEGDPRALPDFHAAAGRIVRERAVAWEEIVRERPLRTAEESIAMTRGIVAGDVSHLARADVRVAAQSRGERAFGMCGRLRTYDVANPV